MIEAKEEKGLMGIGGYDGLVNRYYDIIKKEIEEIKNVQEYTRSSHAFAHWFLVNIRGIDENSVSELITDDFDDWSIDAVYIDNDNEIIELYQFKFPEVDKNIDKKITQDDIASFLMGYKICSSGKAPDNINPSLKDKIEEIVESEIFNYKLVYVSYTSGLTDNAQYVLDQELKKIADSGNQIEWMLYDKKKITNTLYLKKRKFADYEVTLTQAGSSAAIMTSEKASCYTIYCPLDELAQFCRDNSDMIFDENVRLFHGTKNNFNRGIIDTASGDDVINFHLYNNGIVLVSPEVKYIDTLKKLKIKNPMVVNGCQTMNSLVVAEKNGFLTKGYVQVKAIQVNDPEVRQNISIYLNSQTEIKDSYLISNLPIIRQLEEELKQRGYVLLRQANQLEIMKSKMSRKEIEEVLGKNDSKTVKLELAIQAYATFYEWLGPVAKLNKAKLFNTSGYLETIFKNLTPEKLLYSYDVYLRICDVITEYRKFRRNSSKKNIFNIIDMEESKIKEYLFLNTSDLFLLSVYSAILSRDVCPVDKIGKEIEGKEKIESFEEWTKISDESFDRIVREAVNIIHDTVMNDKTGQPPAILTKSAAFHKQLMNSVYKKDTEA